jgi:3-dehydro-L-gulonate 2-dehydrogenase
MAMSQFSWGKIEAFQAEGKLLPVGGGYDEKGKLTRNAADIVKSWRALPIGFWKGSGLSILLDMLAAILSMGQATHQIGSQEDEIGLSQIFLAIDADRTGDQHVAEHIVNQIIATLDDITPITREGEVHYPGEKTLKRREDSVRNGVPIDPHYWRQVREM